MGRKNINFFKKWQKNRARKCFSLNNRHYFWVGVKLLLPSSMSLILEVEICAAKARSFCVIPFDKRISRMRLPTSCNFVLSSKFIPPPYPKDYILIYFIIS